jgi:Uma2 family endonuclease
MSTVVNAIRYTPEDLLLMPDEKNYELVNGDLVERNIGMESSRIGITIGRLVDTFCVNERLGPVFGADAGYQCFPDDPSRVRKADVSFINASRLPNSELPVGYCRIAPDLAVELISPNDLAYEIEEKVREYLEAGVRLIWVVYPPSRLVRVHRLNGTVAEFKEGDFLDGEDVLPRFRCQVKDIFPPVVSPANGKH